MVSLDEYYDIFGRYTNMDFFQVSWYWDSWIGELRNPDKGFMNWICQKLNVPDCAPYQVVVMMADEENACHKPAVI